MARSKWKTNITLLDQDISNKELAIETFSRNLIIIPEYIGNTFLVHNGLMHKKLTITKYMVGQKLGEFIPTKKKPNFDKKKNKKRR